MELYSKLKAGPICNQFNSDILNLQIGYFLPDKKVKLEVVFSKIPN